MKVLFNLLLLMIISGSLYPQSLSRKIHFQVPNEEVILKNDFLINIVDCQNDTLKLIPESNTLVDLPYFFCNNGIYKVFFFYKEYCLKFNKVSGQELNFDADWDFRILKYPFNDDRILLSKIPKSISEVFILEFQPIDGDGWFIYEPNIK